jgi:transcription elongation factor SPT6
MAMEGPYRPSHLLGENRFIVPTGDLPIVAVCSSNDARDGTFLAAVNGRGELSDHVAVPGGTSITSDQIREKVITFLMQMRPAAVVVGSGGGVNSRAIARRLGEVIAEATERWNNRLIQGQDEDDEDYEARMDAFRMMHPHIDDDDNDVWKCNVDIVDDTVAQLFGRSVRGKKEFPDTAINLKVAIAAARWAKDPLCELAYTWSVASDAGVFGTEMLFLNIHPLQRLLPKTLLLREYQRVLCDVTAEVGVDINGACSYDHMHGLLSFVPGLGPRKASILKQNVSRIGGVVSSRKSILAKRLLGPIVYNNAVAFLRIRATDQLQDQMLHPLDDSRCHPDVYQRNRWAVQIAVDALELGDGAANDDDAITAIRDVMQNSKEEVVRLFKETKIEWEAVYGPTPKYISSWDPKITVPADSWRDKVEDLDIEAFGDIIESNGSGKWLSQLTMVKWEFRLPYVDPRKPMEPPSGEKLFKLLTGESDATLCPGKEVTGMIVKNGDFGSQVKLEGDVPGFIPLRNLADDHVESAEDVVSVGTVVTALITQVKMDHMCVDLSLKKEDFRKKSSEWERPKSLPPLDDNFDKIAALRVDEEKDKDRQARLEALRLTIGGTKIGSGSEGANAEGSSATARRSGKVTRRACAHPAFRNSAHATVDKELKENGNAMVGDALIRPSNKSCDSLAIHWLVRPGCIKVIEVIEQDKDTDASVGNRLIIKVCKESLFFASNSFTL